MDIRFLLFVFLGVAAGGCFQWMDMRFLCWTRVGEVLAFGG
ncbi:MAG: hypothetical protein ABWY08_13440 [Comamonas sp.]